MKNTKKDFMSGEKAYGLINKSLTELKDNWAKKGFIGNKFDVESNNLRNLLLESLSKRYDVCEHG